MTLATTPRIVAIVPLRAGSKGLPGKNVRLLAGKPLYAHTVDHARIAGLSEVVISTDIGSLIGADLGPNVHVASRPAELARDDTQMSQVLSNLLSTTVKGPATIVLLQATSPLRDPSHINRAIAAFL
jgi:CMP-N,N'-diacetyllegionaminic acid synthase